MATPAARHSRAPEKRGARPVSPAASPGTASSAATAAPSSPNAYGNPDFVQAFISDPGTNTIWSCTIKNANAVSSPVLTAAGTAICISQ